MTSLLALLGLGITLPLGVRWPGVLLAGLFFCYVVGALTGVSSLTPIYAAIALFILLIRALSLRISPAFLPLDAAFTLFLVWYAISGTYAVDSVAGASASMNMIFSAGPVYLMARLVGIFDRSGSTLAEVAIGFAVLGSIVALAVAANGIQVNGRLVVPAATVVGTAQAFPYVAIAGVGILLLYRGNSLALYGLGALAITAGLSISILTGTRGNLLSFAGGLAVLVLASYRRVPWRVAALILSGAVMLFSLDLSTGGQALQRVLNIATYGADDDLSSRLRYFYFDAAWALFANAPVIGAGAGSFAYFSGVPYPHNMVLEILSSSGLIGLSVASLTGLLAINTARNVKVMSLEWQGPVLVAILAGGLVQHQVSLSIVDAKSLYLVGLLAGLADLDRRRTGRLPGQSSPAASK